MKVNSCFRNQRFYQVLAFSKYDAETENIITLLQVVLASHKIIFQKMDGKISIYNCFKNI